MTPEPVKAGEDADADAAKKLLEQISEALGGGKIVSYSVVAQKENGTVVQQTQVKENKKEEA